MDFDVRTKCSSDKYQSILKNYEENHALTAVRPFHIAIILSLAASIFSYFAGSAYGDHQYQRDIARTYKAEPIRVVSQKSVDLSHAVAVVPSPAPPTAPAAKPVLQIDRGNWPDSYIYGQCTYYVARRRHIPANWGNANTWFARARAAGFSEGTIPRPGAIAWTSAGYYGHVAYVESVGPNDIIISEMNFSGNWNRVTYRAVSDTAFKYIY